MIQKIAFDGYRLLDGFAADLGRLTVVIGANASGKSTLLDALQLVSEMVSGPFEDAIFARGGLRSLSSIPRSPNGLSLSVTFKRPTDHAVWGQMPIDEDRSYVYEVQFQTDPLQQPSVISEVLRNDKPHAGHKEAFKLLHADQKESRIFDPRQKKLVPFDQMGGRSPGSQSADAKGDSQPSEVPVPEKPSLLLSKMRFLHEYPQPTWIRAYLASMHFYPGFEVGRFAPIRVRPAEIRPITTLSLNGDNLGTVLHEVLTRGAYRETAAELREFMKTAYPFFEDIFAETAFAGEPRVLVRLQERDLKRPIELWEASDGMLRFLCLAMALLDPVPPALMAIDEPETGLHPRLMPIVADLIKAARERTQVLVTTHSPVLLSCFALEDLAVMARKDSKAVWYRPETRPTLRKMLEAVGGDSLGDLHRSGELEALT